MSSFLKKGERTHNVLKRKQTQKHIKGFYKILHEMDDLAKQLDPSLEYTEDVIKMELMEMIAFNAAIIGFVAYITHLAIKSAKQKSKHKHG